MNKKTKYIYMVVTNDKYELPLIVSESIIDIARYTGRTIESIYSSLAHYYNGRRNCNIRRIEVDEE